MSARERGLSSISRDLVGDSDWGSASNRASSFWAAWCSCGVSLCDLPISWWPFISAPAPWWPFISIHARDVTVCTAFLRRRQRPI